MAELTSLSNKFPHLHLAAAISAPGEGVNGLKKLYQQAEEASAYKILYDRNHVIRYPQLTTAKVKLNLGKRDFEKMEEAVNSHALQPFGRLIDQWFSKELLAGQTIGSIKKLYDIVLKKITGLLSSQEIIFADIPERDFNQFFSLEEIRAYLKNYLYKVTQHISQQQKKEKTVVDIAKKYIQENFNKEINMAEISNMISMNYSYFSKLFKTETGMTFTEYLMKLRMEEAKRLLSNPVNRVAEVALNVGYEDSHNFSRAFKHYFGFSPNDYRKF